MASITYWNRVEPRPASGDIAAPLQAQVRDALWFLTRQWQLGEFLGVDSGSPAYVTLTGRIGAVTQWRRPDGTATPIGVAPIEQQIEGEPFTPDLATRIELGQVLSRLLAEAGAAVAGALFRAAYPIAAAVDDAADPAEAQLRRVCAGRAIDGVAAYAGIKTGAASVPPAPKAALAAFVAWTEGLVGSISDTPADAPAWQPARLEYQASVDATVTAGIATLDVHPGDDGLVDWAAFDLAATTTAAGTPEQPAVTPEQPATAPAQSAAALTHSAAALAHPVAALAHPAAAPAHSAAALAHSAAVTSGPPASAPANPAATAPPPQTPPTPAPAPAATVRSIVPAHVRFKGMPNARFWDFENGTLDFGDMKPDKRDLARLALMDFMLVHANDWFMVPFDMPLGGTCQFDSLVVHDVFGIDTLIERADRENLGPGGWTLFATSVSGQDGATADFFLLPPSAGSALQAGAVVEEVQFARDEMANMIWAIENVLEDAAGNPWPQHERDSANHPIPTAVAAQGAAVPLQYRIESRVPEYWIPFLPVSLDAATGAVALELAAALADDGHTLIPPRGRILKPSAVGPSAPYQIPEEEVPRNGLRVQRFAARSRCTDGSTRIWQLRRVLPGSGEAASALRFDQALPTP